MINFKKIPYFSYKLSKSALGSVERNVSESDIDLKKNAVKGTTNAFVVINPDKYRFNYMIPIVHEKKLYTALFPNPVHLFFSQAIGHYNLSEEIKKQFDKNVIKTYNPNKLSEMFKIPDELYNSYISQKISALTSLMMTVETFLNFLITENFRLEEDNVTKYETERKYSIKQKITKIIPQIIKINNLESYQERYNKILIINYLRNDFIHLKTKKDNRNMDAFVKVFEKLVNFNLKEKIHDVKDFVNYLKPDYIETHAS